MRSTAALEATLLKLTDYRQWNGVNGIGVKTLIVYFIKRVAKLALQPLERFETVAVGQQHCFFFSPLYVHYINYGRR